MPIAAGARFGPYEILAPLGSGGMGEVYRARDTKLDRDVAVKILPETFALDPDRLMRFEREAKTLAALNHPHVAHVYGVEEALASTLREPQGRPEQGRGATGSGQAGVRALVMELVEGDDLTMRLAHGAIPLEEALGIAVQIASALEAAHVAGIIHRDLKPANVKVRPDGTVKVLDFGLAKAVDPIGGSSAGLAAASPTFTSPAFAPGGASARQRPAVTQMGMILGTAAYMAPEQARGKAVDRRADVWAFGVVLHEMLTGVPLFARGEVSDTLAAVLTHEPDPTALPPRTPTAVRRVLARCLTKDVARRLDSMMAVRLELEDALANPEPAASLPGRRVWSLGAVATAALAAGLAVGIFVTRSTAPPRAPEAPLIAQVGAPPEVISAFHHGFALSPDGRTLAFTARDATGVRQLWVRRLDSLEARPLPNTEDAVHPFWSPDGTQLAFFAGGQVRRIAAAGGPARVIAPAPGQFPTASWSDRDEILYGVFTGAAGAIFTVPAAGGTPAVLDLTPAGIRPSWLPGGDRFVYSATAGEPGVYVAAAAGGAATRVIALATGGEVADPVSYAHARDGYLFTNEGAALTVHRFDQHSAAVVGEGIPIAGRVGTPGGWFALSSAAGALVAFTRMSPSDRGLPGDPIARLTWVTRDGEPAGDLAGPKRFWTHRLSPDGRSAMGNPESHLWLYEPGGRQRRVTSGAGGDAFNAVWSPDGAEIVFTITPGAIARTPVDREAEPTRLPGIGGLVEDWSPDGRTLLVRTGSPAARANLVLYDLRTQTARPWLATPANESQGRFSPDGRWVAYVSDAQGRQEVFLKPLEGEQTPHPVSSGGGLHPAWRADGRELFYLGPGDEIMAVPITAAAGRLEPGAARRLFRIPLNDISRGTFSPFDVTPDGQRFLLNVIDAPEPLLYVRGLESLIPNRSSAVR